MIMIKSGLHTLLVSVCAKFGISQIYFFRNFINRLMLSRFDIILFLAFGLVFFAGPLHAQNFVRVNICGVVNGPPDLGATSMPRSRTNYFGNTGTGIPFDTCGDGSKILSVFTGTRTPSPATSNTATVPLPPLSGQNTLYALLNNYFGTAGVNEYDVVVTFTDETSVTFESRGGTDTRDYNNNDGTPSTITAGTTVWWSNFSGTDIFQRLDVRKFDLSGYSTKTLSSLTINQVNLNSPAMLSGVTLLDSLGPTLPTSDGRTIDTIAPTLVSSNPAHDATGVAVGSNIVLTFSENIKAGTGDIVISDGAGDTRTIPIGDAQITIVDSTLTINPTADLNSSTTYHVQIAPTAVDDLADNSYLGIADTTTLNFTTADVIAPVITGPSGGAGAATSAITVNENQTAVTQFTANEAISSWTLSGDDAAKFAIAADGTLTFVAAPDFENPTDAGDTAANNTYVVIISATDSSSNASSQTLTVTVANVEDTPAEAFAANAQTIRQIVTDEANRTLRNTVSANRNMVQSARDRFADDMRENAVCGRDDQIDQEDRAYRDFQEVCTETVATRDYIPFDVDGAFSLSGATLSTNGTFFGQNGSADGTWRRLFFGDFNVQRDGNTGSNTATLSARVAWEQMVSETTMLGYFIGAELGESDIKGSFTGDQTRVALTLGGYAVHELAEQVYLDGFLTFGAGRNDLSMSNDVLALDSDYTTRTATLGAAVSGIYEYEAYEFHPDLSFSYGHTWVGNVGFTGRAYGLVDNTLSLNAGSVTLANVMFRPEFRIPLDGLQASKSLSLLTFAPRMICEQVKATTTTKNCGSGAEFGIATHSADGLSNVNAKILADRLGNSTRSGLQLNLEHRF
jgi:methionine-rich copper-binding protein CopC